MKHIIEGFEYMPLTYYYLELLVSPGPRKEKYKSNPAMRELGEDAGGILTLPRASFFWIADGTSEESVLYDFSSRIFAQDLGLCYQKVALNEYKNKDIKLNLNIIIKKTFVEIENLWKERLKKRWDKLNESQQDQFINNLIHCGDNTRRRSWSSTFLGGFINYETMELMYFNAGDCGGFFNNLNDEMTLIIPNRKRIFIVIDCYPEDQYPICTLIRASDIEEKIGNEKNVKNFAFITDGNTNRSLNKLLYTLLEQNSIQSISYLLKRLRQKTYDDRAILFGSSLDY